MRTRNLALIVAGLWAVLPLQAGLFEDIYRGLNILATPSGSPLSPSVGGLSNGNRFGRLRLVPDRVGRGWTIEFNRVFGTDVSGRPEVLDLGPLELELNGSISSTLDFTRRSFGVDGFLERGFLIGTADFVANGLNYRLRGKTGTQDFEWSGTLNVANNIELNALGFYEATINVSNTNSSLTADGIAVEGDVDTDFDFGPISVQGNVFFDMFVLALSSLGVDTSELERIFPRSPIDLITDELQASLQRQAQAVLGESVQADALDARSLGLRTDRIDGSAAGQSYPPGEPAAAPAALSAVPEPAAPLLLCAGALLAARRRAA